MMVRLALSLSAFLSLFFFPYPLTLALSFVASLYIPFAALIVGICADLVYLSWPEGGSALPVATLLGGALSLGALFVRRFVRERIIGG
jgi:hypothetical protein